MLKHIFIIFFLMGTYLSATSQSLDSFSKDRSAFIKELETIMTASKRKAMEELYENFEKFYKSGAFTDEEFEMLIATSNGMLQQKMKASPYFSGYLNCLLIVKKTQDAEKNFKELHQVLNAILANIENRRLRPYDDFLTFAHSFYEQNALRYSRNGVVWRGFADNYQLLYEDKQPIVRFEKLDLQASRKKDSIVILGTSGTYYPLDLIWKGEGGKVTWEGAGLDANTYVELGPYELETKKAIYEVEEVELFYPDLFPGRSVKGSFTHKLTVRNNKREASYPRFESSKAILEINDIGEGIKYVGGFRLHGTTVYGYGTSDNKANITIEQGKYLLNANAELFVIRKGERLASEGVEATLHYGQDSLYHPSVNIKFDIPDRILRMYRGDRGSDRNPFFNSLYQVNIDVDNIDWYMNSDSMVLGKNSVSFSKGLKSVDFESLKFFSEGSYRRLQNIGSTNPIAMLKIMSVREGTNMISAKLIASKINSRFDVSSIQPLLYDLVSQGFINYHKDEEMVEIKDKIHHYADASQDKVDYDYLKITSKSDSVNAVVMLNSNVMTTYGVENVIFSQVQKVALKPFMGSVAIRENRNMDFDGKVFAGYSSFDGKSFSYDYNRHHIEMDSVRYFDLFVPTDAVDDNGDTIALSIGSRIEHAKGILLIDAPNNKAGKEDIPLFPSFNSTGPSFVYYDQLTNQGGCYKRDSFYFELDKFSFNGLDDFSKEDINFKGKMVSAEIFPDYRETLVIRGEEESLGFVTETPEEGYPTYQGQGNYKGKIDLSNQGYLGQGTLRYLQASVNSEDIIFKPRQMLATADRFDLEEARNSDPEVPQAVGYDVSIDWKPYQDSMYIRTAEKPFELYKEPGYSLAGTAILTPGGLKGDGQFKWEKGALNSKLMSFGAFSVNADTSSLKIYAIGQDALAFDTRNVKTDLDFDEQMGEVKANKVDEVITMPYNKYITTLNDFTWDMTEETITFQNEMDKFGDFTSIDPNQDSLRFQGKSAFYDLKTNELKIGGIPSIQTSDAYVYTETGDIQIEKGGKMRTLENAKIVADTLTKHHVINRATVNILGKKEYRASGFYEYNIGDKVQEIEFQDIVGTRVGKGKQSEKKSVTRAKGEVKETDNFYIDHKTEYRGTISLNAETKNLSFDGFARLDVPMMPNRQWFSVNFEGDKSDLAIAYDVPKNYRGDPLQTGLYLSKETAKVYSRIMMPKQFRKDRPVLEAKGYFKYDVKADQFNFGDSAKILHGAIRGNKLTYNNKDGNIVAEGNFEVGSALQYVKVKAAGKVETSLREESGQLVQGDVKANFMAGIDLLMPDKLMAILLTDLKSSSFDARVIDYLKEGKYYETALAEFVPTDKEYNSAVVNMKNIGSGPA